MVRRFTVFLTCLVILICVLACTTTPKYNFPHGTRVGVINLLEPYATHQQFSTLTSDNFKKTYDVDWDMPSYAEDQLKTQLEKDAGFTIVNIKVSEPLEEKTLRLKMVEQVLVSETAPPTVPPRGASLLDRISHPYDVQIVILISSYNGPSPYKNNEKRVNVEGYGLFTRWLFRGIFRGFLSFRKAYAYAQVGVVVYKVQPVTYIAAARTISKGRPLRPIKGFDWKANLSDLPKSELDKTKSPIQEDINAAVKKAIRNANLTPSSPR